MAYLLLLAGELGYIDDGVIVGARQKCDAVVAQLEALLNTMDGFLKEERRTSGNRRI